MKRGIIDRFEGELAVIEVNNVTMDVPKSKLPPTAKEGDVLIIEGDTYTIDKDETDKRRLEIQDLMNKLFE
ncbi:pyruvate kinase [Bacillus anthracis]|nr:pyruvate kinase [Bacillus anthracis]PGX27543.1 pyruvate kinase [Bacillus anthracis]